MASRKETPVTANPKPSVVAEAPPRLSARPAPLPRSATADPRQLMREAAWSRMFGRVEAKNPFTR